MSTNKPILIYSYSITLVLIVSSSPTLLHLICLPRDHQQRTLGFLITNSKFSSFSSCINMSRPQSAPPNRSAHADKHSHSNRDHESHRNSDDSDEDKPSIILLEGRQKEILTQRILQEQELELLEKAKIKELKEKDGYKFTSDVAEKAYLKVQQKDTNTFMECNNFARDCKEAIRSDPRTDSRADPRKKGGSVSSLNALLTPEKKAQHFKRLATLLTSLNKYAQYWSIEDFPDEWFKIDNAVLCSKEEQGVLVKEAEKKRKVLEKSKNGGKVEVEVKSKGRRPVSMHEIEKKKNIPQKQVISKAEVEGKHGGERRAPTDEAERKKKIVVEKPRTGKTEANGKPKEGKFSIAENEKTKKTPEKPKDGKVEVDEKPKEQRRVRIDEPGPNQKAPEKSKIGRLDVDGRPKEQHGVQVDEAEKKKRNTEKSKISKGEVDVGPKDQHNTQIDEVEKKRNTPEKPKTGKGEVDGKPKIDNAQAKKRHGSQ